MGDYGCTRVTIITLFFMKGVNTVQEILPEIMKVVEKWYQNKVLKGENRYVIDNGRIYDVLQELSRHKEAIKKLADDYATSDSVKEQLEQIEGLINGLEAQIGAVSQTVVADIQPLLLKLYNNLKTTNINLAKNELNDKIYHQKDDPTKPISQLTDLVVDPLTDNTGMDASLSNGCYYDTSSKTIRSLTASYRRPIYKKVTPELEILNINGGIVFYDVVQQPPAPTTIHVYCLTKQYDLIYIQNVNKFFIPPYKLTTNNKEILPPNPQEIFGGYCKSEDAFYFIVSSSSTYTQFKLFKLDLSNNTFSEVVGISGALPFSSNITMSWFDNENEKFIFKMHAGYGGSFYIYDPDTNTMAQSSQSFPPAGILHYKAGAYDEKNKRYVFIQPELMKVYTFQYSNVLNDVVVNEQSITSPLPAYDSSTSYFVKEDYMYIMYPQNPPFTVYKLNINTGAITIDETFIFPQNTPLRSYFYSAFGYAYYEESGQYYGFAVIINPYNVQTLSYTWELHAWEFKHPISPGTNTNWQYVSNTISTTYIPRYAYALLEGLQNQDGQLLGVSYSIDNGATWSQLSDPDDLVDLTSLTGGKQLKIKIHAYGDYEISAYAFGCME